MTENRPVKTIGLLTSGGDAPGMNACIRAVVRAGLARGWQMIGIEDGFEGLLKERFRELEARDVGGILQRGGTILQTARCDPFMQPEGQREAVDRKSTRLNSSHQKISYAVFCLKKKK